MIQLTIPRVTISGVAALLLSSATWAVPTVNAGTAALDYGSMDRNATNIAADEPWGGNGGGGHGAGGGKPGGGHPGGGHPGGGKPGGGHPGGGKPGGGHPGGGKPGGGHPGGGHPGGGKPGGGHPGGGKPGGGHPGGGKPGGGHPGGGKPGGGHPGGGKPGGGHPGGGKPGGGHPGGGHPGGGHPGGGKPGGGHPGGGKPGGGHPGGGHPGGGHPGGGHPGGGHPGGGKPGGGHPGGGKPGGGHPGGGHPGGGKPGGGHHNGGRPVGVDPGRPVHHARPGRVNPHKDLSHRECRVTRDNIGRAYHYANGLRRSAASISRINGWKHDYATRHNNYLRTRYNHCGGFYRNDAYRYGYSRWFNHGFCGGFYYPVHPWYDIGSYFVYPMVNWMYVGAVDVTYYREWYGADYDVCPVTSFPYARAYFPTQQMRDLGTDMSALDAKTQCAFRTAMVIISKSIMDQVSASISATYAVGDSDIVVTHYENLNNASVVLEGFVTQDNINLPFKAVLDLVTAANTVVFMPKDADPSVDQINELDRLNQKIKDNGGDPTITDDEPDSLVAPPPLNP